MVLIYSAFTILYSDLVGQNPSVSHSIFYKCPMTTLPSPIQFANLKNLLYSNRLWWKDQVTNHISKLHLHCPIRKQTVSFLWAETPYCPYYLCLGPYLKASFAQPTEARQGAALRLLAYDTHRVITRNTSVSATVFPGLSLQLAPCKVKHSQWMIPSRIIQIDSSRSLKCLPRRWLKSGQGQS